MGETGKGGSGETENGKGSAPEPRQGDEKEREIIAPPVSVQMSKLHSFRTCPIGHMQILHVIIGENDIRPRPRWHGTVLAVRNSERDRDEMFQRERNATDNLLSEAVAATILRLGGHLRPERMTGRTHGMRGRSTVAGIW